MIVLASCETGKSSEDKKSIAQLISEKFVNSIIKAPTGVLNFKVWKRDGVITGCTGVEVLKEPASDDKPKEYVTKEWSYFFRGNEVPRGQLPLVLTLLHFELSVKNQLKNAKIEY